MEICLVQPVRALHRNCPFSEVHSVKLWAADAYLRFYISTYTTCSSLAPPTPCLKYEESFSLDCSQLDQTHLMSLAGPK